MIGAWRAAARATSGGRRFAGRFSSAARTGCLLLAALVCLAASGGVAAIQPQTAAGAPPMPEGYVATAETARAPTPEAAREAFAATVVGIDDGDSFVARRRDGTKIRIRIAGIDAPEKSQPWAALARKRLRELLHGREIAIVALKTDRWGRRVALIEVDGADPALTMLADGLAWHFARYDRDLPAPLRLRYAQAQAKARERQAGLWQAPDPEPPWEFRKRNRR